MFDRLWPFDTKIAVTGIAGGGKTVFLTSLLWQLSEISHAQFTLANRVSIEGFRETKLDLAIGQTFPLDRFRDTLAHEGNWPEKTADCLSYACEYSRSDWRIFNQRLRFFDFPGERIADAAISANEDYLQWSDNLLKHWRDRAEYRNAALPYFELIEKPNPKEAELLTEYKRTLARLVHGYKPMISPSTFLLDTAGNPAPYLDVEELAATRLSGLPSSEFVPLPARLIRRFPDMKIAFTRYRNEVALPLFGELGECRRLIVLVDIPSLLVGGVGRYNDNRRIVLDLFDSLRPDSTLGGKLLNLLNFWAEPLDRVAFVAVKADMVHPDDVKNGKLESLLKQMTFQTKSMLPDVKFDWFIASACHSTRPGKGSGTLVGKLTRDNPGRKEKEFSIVPLPERWPEEWEAGTFRFHPVWPEVSRNIQIPPKHLGLNDIFDFITSD